MKNNLIPGFRACFIFLLDHAWPLPKILTTCTLLDVNDNSSCLNETLIDQKRIQTRDTKIVNPGEVLSSTMLEVSAGSTSNAITRIRWERMKRCNNQEEKSWICYMCKESYNRKDDGRNRWIVCDVCDKKYHLISMICYKICCLYQPIFCLVCFQIHLEFSEKRQ